MHGSGVCGQMTHKFATKRVDKHTLQHSSQELIELIDSATQQKHSLPGQHACMHARVTATGCGCEEVGGDADERCAPAACSEVVHVIRAPQERLNAGAVDALRQAIGFEAPHMLWERLSTLPASPPPVMYRHTLKYT
jgi:hypothetical protein